MSDDGSMRICTPKDLAAWLEEEKQRRRWRRSKEGNSSATTPLSLLPNDTPEDDTSLNRSPYKSLLIIDLRSTTEYTCLHISDITVHVVVPTFIFSRASYTAEKVVNVLSTEQISLYQTRHQAGRILLIGAGACIQPPKVVDLMWSKLVSDGCCRDKIFWLEGTPDIV